MMDPRRKVEERARGWVSDFGGISRDVAVLRVQRRFDGTAIARVRATTGHDSYERLVTVSCKPSDHAQAATTLDALPDLLQQPEATGINAALILEEAYRDPNVVEFNRFYLERRENELRAAGNDARKRKKLEDDFTPQIDATLVALDGRVSRCVNVKVRYQLDGVSYESELAVIPSDGRIETAPVLERCALGPFADKRYALSMAVNSRNAVDINIALFETLGRLSLHGLWLAALSAGQDEAFGQAVSEQADKVLNLAISNSEREPGAHGPRSRRLRDRTGSLYASRRRTRPPQQRCQLHPWHIRSPMQRNEDTAALSDADDSLSRRPRPS